MKRNSVASITGFTIGLAAAAQVAQAACPTPVLTGAQLITTLNGKYVCAKRPAGNTPNPGCGNPNDTWNEFHRGTGAGPFPIIDYKKGPNDPVDPSKPVGTYQIDVGANTVTYNYGDPCGPYTYTVKALPPTQSGNPNFQFCNVATNELIPAIVSASPNNAFCTAAPVTGAAKGIAPPLGTKK